MTEEELLAEIERIEGKRLADMTPQERIEAAARAAERARAQLEEIAGRLLKPSDPKK